MAMNNKIALGLTLAVLTIAVITATTGVAQIASASLCCDNWSFRGGDHDNHGDCGDSSDCGGGSSG
jgi:hypothetical protein